MKKIRLTSSIVHLAVFLWQDVIKTLLLAILWLVSLCIIVVGFLLFAGYAVKLFFLSILCFIGYLANDSLSYAGYYLWDFRWEFLQTLMYGFIAAFFVGVFIRTNEYFADLNE